jgi:hypothetical protein
MTQEFASDNRSEGADRHYASLVQELSEIEGLRMPYRPVADYPRSILPADPELGLSACIIETQKGFKREDGLISTRTTVDQNFQGDRQTLVVDYFEPDHSSPSMQAKFSCNGQEQAEVVNPVAGNSPNFPMSLRADQITLKENETLKTVIHEALFEFRHQGVRGFLNCLESFKETPPLEQEQVSADMSQVRDFTLIGNICELCRVEFRVLSQEPAEPYPVIFRVPAPNIGIAFEHESGVQMTLNLLPIEKINNEPVYYLQQVRLALPAKGWTSIVPFTDSHERYYIDALWTGETADLDLDNGQVRSLIKGYNQILVDYLSGDLGKVSDYFKGVKGYHAIFAENLHSRIADRSRKSRLDS